MILQIEARWKLFIKILQKKTISFTWSNKDINDKLNYTCIKWRTFVHCLLFDFAYICRRRMVGVCMGVYKKMEYTMHCTVSKKEHKLFVFSLKIFTFDTYIWLISEWTSGCFFLYRWVCIHVIRNFACRIFWIRCPSLRKLFHIETEGTYFAGQKFHLFRWGRTDLQFYL